MDLSWARARMTTTCLLVAVTAFGLTGCENLGKRAAEAVTQPSQGPHHHRPKGATPAAARAFVHRTFALFEHGQSFRGCTFSESKPYRAVDRTCVPATQKIVAALHAHGVSAIPRRISVDLHGTHGTATYTWMINGHRATSSNYLRYDGHRWWMTGERKTGDLGL